jgi:hypothetical protein
VNELGNVVAWGKADVDGVFGSRVPVIIFEALAQCVSGDTNNRIYLWVERFPPAEGVHRDVVFLNFSGSSFEVLFADVGEKPDMVVCPPQYTRGQDVLNL